MTDSSTPRRHGVSMSEEELQRVLPAETHAFRSPVPTQIVSNGEYNPLPQTEKQRQVEGLIKEFAGTYGKKLGMDRRQFLKSASGMAAAFLAMNKVFGPVWNVSEAEAAEKEVAEERARSLKGQFIFDDQTHFVRDDFNKEGLLALGDYASKHWNPDMLKSMPLTLQRYKYDNYMKEVFMDSDTKIALLSGAPFDDPGWWLLPNEAIAKTRDSVNKTAGTRRMFGHFVFTPKYPHWIEDAEAAIGELKPDAWKGYTVGDPLSPSSKGTYWRLDDEKEVYPFYEKIVKAGITNVCIHKGPMPADYEKSWKDIWQYNTVWDVPKAAKDWPQINFIIYHAALRGILEAPDAALAEFEKTGYIQWATELAMMRKKYGLENIYAELGSSFASSAVTSPRFAGAFIGQLVNELGPDRVVWGTDSVWYGSPQWQIEALRRLEIPEDMMKKMGWKTQLGAADSPVKSAIFGLNSARLYKYDVQANYEQLTNDQLAHMKREYESEGVPRNNAFYGYIAKSA